MRLDDYSTAPLYNIKAVVQATDISPSTLRAWERRYQIFSPKRSEGGYRLYSEQDIAIIQWLKAQINAGMSIRQAASWLTNLTEQNEHLAHSILPNSKQTDSQYYTDGSADSIDYIAYLQKELLNSLLTFDEDKAEKIISECFSLYPVEIIGENLFSAILYEIGDRWHRGDLSITMEHYITSYLMQRLAAILRTTPNADTRPLLWVGCVHEELHEIGPLLLCIYLRRAGYQVRYLGANLPIDDFATQITFNNPDMILLSASTLKAVSNLTQMVNKINKTTTVSPIVVYGGQIFNKVPELHQQIYGATFISEPARNIVQTVKTILNKTLPTD